MKDSTKELLPWALIAMIVVSAFCFGCVSAPTLPTEGTFAPMNELVLWRHDSYVIDDTELDEVQMDAYLRESAVIIALLRKDDIDVGMFKLVADPVYNRHDNYVDSDTSLTEDERIAYTLTTYRLRRRMAALLGEPVPPSPFTTD